MLALCHATSNSGSIGRMRALSVFLVVAVTACPGLVGESRTDSGTRADGGVAQNDSGTPVIDAGMPGPLDAGPLLDAGTIAALDFRFELATPEQIGLYLPVTGAIATQSKVTVRSKVAGSSAWQVAHPLLRVDPASVASGAPVAPVDAFAGTVFDLQPGTLYDVEVTLVQPDVPNQVQIQRTSTRALPAVTGATTVTASPGDYGTRNIGFYDNGITNCATFLSLDPLWGGPLYAFRNVVVNTFRGPFKLNNTNSGFLIYNNTIVRTEGTTGWGWVQFNNGSLKAWSYRNNILLYRGAGNLLAIESTGNAPIDFTNNAWFPDKAVWWSSTGGSFNSISLAAAGLPATAPLFSASTKRHENDVIAEQDPFVTAVTLGADYLTEFAADPVLTLRAGTAAKGTGVELPNITNGHAGAAPDVGAVIEGRPQPRWGALRP